MDIAVSMHVSIPPRSDFNPARCIGRGNQYHVSIPPRSDFNFEKDGIVALLHSTFQSLQGLILTGHGTDCQIEKL